MAQAGGQEGAAEPGTDEGDDRLESCACLSRGPLLVLAGGLMFLLVNNALWTLESPLPSPMHDLRDHLELLTQAIRQISQDGLAGAWELWTHGYFPPLLHIFGWGLKWLMDSHWYFVYVPGALSILGIGLGTYLAGTTLFGRRAGALAGLLAASTPIVVGMSRTFDPQLSSAALVALAIGVALRSGGFTRTLPTLAAFGLATVAAMTNRVVPVLHLALPFLLIEHSGRRFRQHRPALVAGVALFCLLAGPFHLNWLVQWLGSEAGRLRLFGEADAGQFHGIRAWLYYVLVLPDNQFHLPLSMALLLALPSLAYASSFQRRLLAAWWLAPALFFTLIPRKDPVYDLPGLPALAVVVAWALAHAVERAGVPAVAPAGRFATLRGRLLRLRFVAVCLFPAALVAAMLSDTMLGSWTSYDSLMATEQTTGVFPAAQWMREPIGGREEMSFILKVLGQMAQDFPPPDEIRAVETADFWFGRPETSLNSPRSTQFWQAYTYRATLPYVAEVHVPRVRIASTLWPWLTQWNCVFQEFHKVQYLFFTTRGDTDWPDHGTLGRIRDRFLPILPDDARQRSDQLVDNIVRSRPNFSRFAQLYVPRYKYYLFVYKRIGPGVPPLQLPPPP